MTTKRWCSECSYLASLLREQRGVVAEFAKGIAIAAIVNAITRTARLRAMAPPIDIEAERIVLGAALRTGAPLIPELFVFGHHYALAVAITTGQLEPELLYPEAAGYRRGLRGARCSLIELHAAMDTLFALRAQRMALSAAERAVTALRDPEGAARGVVELRAALEALTECESEFAPNGNLALHECAA